MNHKDTKRRSLVVGLTGGIGAGKSLALSEFARLGAATMSSDEIARAQSRRGQAAYRAIRKAFGTVDRARLAALVFSDAAKRRRLERITHPLIIKELRERIKASRGVVVVDVPLLFEAKLEKEFDATMAISAPASRRLARVTRRDRSSPGDVRRRMASQFSDAERAARADVVVLNVGAPSQFRRKIRSYHRALDLMVRSDAS